MSLSARRSFALNILAGASGYRRPTLKNMVWLAFLVDVPKAQFPLRLNSWMLQIRFAVWLHCVQCFLFAATFNAGYSSYGQPTEEWPAEQRSLETIHP